MGGEIWGDMGRYGDERVQRYTSLHLAASRYISLYLAASAQERMEAEMSEYNAQLKREEEAAQARGRDRGRDRDRDRDRVKVLSPYP